MSVSPPVRSAGPLPVWLMVLGSVLVVGHLAAVMILVLAAPSGPWPGGMGGTTLVPPPAFAGFVNEAVVNPFYLRPLKMTHNYHFMTNRPAVEGVFFEVRLKDDKGEVFKTVTIPDQKANFWLRHRQQLLASALAPDQPLEQRRGDTIYPPGTEIPKMSYWVFKNDRLILTTVSELDVPRDNPQLMRPSTWSLLLVRSYVRYLCRQHGAVSGEMIRHTREPLPTQLLMEDGPAAFPELIASYGEMSR
jgi:hypothetical protein